jgi:S1-C subfamily serine protease
MKNRTRLTAACLALLLTAGSLSACRGNIPADTGDGSSAADLLQPGDIVLSFNGSRISGSSDLEQALYRCDAGDTVELILYRSRQQITVQLTLDEAGK